MSLSDSIGNATSLLKEVQTKQPKSEKTFYIYEDGKTVSTSKNPKDERSRRFSIRTYIRVEVLDRFLKTCPYIQEWAYCCHDKDTNEDGTPKQAHTHVLLYTISAKTASALQKNFDRLDKANPSPSGLPEATHVEIMRDTCGSWRYLRHLDDPEKFQYTEDERVSNHKEWWFTYERTDGLNDCSNNTALRMFDDILAGLSTREMIMKYGKDYAFHIKSMERCVELHRIETQSNYAIPFDRNLLNVILSSSNYKPQDIAIFNTILAFVQRSCMEHYGSTLDLYIKEDIQNHA